jgi:hypothetical protein
MEDIMLAQAIRLMGALGSVGRFLEGIASLLNAAIMALWLYGYDARMAELEARLDALEKCLHAASDQDQTGSVSQEIQSLLEDYSQKMDVQYQVGVLSRQLLMLPALPEEGY